MADNLENLKPNPIIEKLASADELDTVVELTGFLGSIQEDYIRLYENLEMTKYLDVRVSDVVHINVPADDAQMATLFVSVRARIENLLAQDTGEHVPDDSPIAVAMAKADCAAANDDLERVNKSILTAVINDKWGEARSQCRLRDVVKATWRWDHKGCEVRRRLLDEITGSVCDYVNSHTQ